ncbi:pentapeptide repeat-containing protein [Nostoc sp.]
MIFNSQPSNFRSDFSEYGANLKGAKLKGSNLEGAKLKGANIEEAIK